MEWKNDEVQVVISLKIMETTGQTTGTGNQNQADYASTQNLQGNAITNTNNIISSSSTQLSPKFAFKPTTSGGLTTPTSGTNTLQLQQQHQQQRYPHSSTQISPRIANNNSNKPPPLQPPPPPPPPKTNTNNIHPIPIPTSAIITQQHPLI
ncbi:hypothetical protein EVAR_72418_1 [Eumeta japonica]|uniref:Uncharacterized protein n=1 Tax=Eumeta variegata TaxID=151549 RepID=A0A4C1TEY9_EUMVA|nr:hypothetical protein EVAR_72418_1 [Eumeta japonica]